MKTKLMETTWIEFKNALSESKVENLKFELIDKVQLAYVFTKEQAENQFVELKKSVQTLLH